MVWMHRYDRLDCDYCRTKSDEHKRLVSFALHSVQAYQKGVSISISMSCSLFNKSSHKNEKTILSFLYT